MSAVRSQRPAAGALALLAATAAVALWLAAEAGAGGPAALPELVRTAAVAVAFFAVCGYGPARLLLPPRMRARLWLYTLPLGAACGTLELTLLGVLHVPLDVSIAVVLVLGAGLATLAVRRVPRVPAPEGGLTAHLVVPLALCAVFAAVACLPAIRAGIPAVQGQNGDAVLAVGTANFLRNAPPEDIRPELPLDRVPPLWRSKLPIYYGLGAVSRLAGQDTVSAFTPTAAVVLALALLGFLLFVVDGFGLSVLVGLGAMVAAGLDRMVMFTVYGPYYNQLWALFSLPFMLLFGWRFLRDPDRSSAVLAGVFVALALLTYPLLLPFPVVFFALIVWRRRRERGWLRALRLPAPRSGAVRYVLLALVTLPVLAVLVRGINEKAVPGLVALAPGGDLSAWSGMGFLPFHPFGWFFGVSAGPAVTAVALAAIFAAALFAVWRLRDDGAIALLVLVVGALLGAAYLVARGGGELFYFKDLSFTGPLVVMLAVVGMAALRPRALAVAAVAVFALVAAEGTRDAVVGTYEQTPRHVLELGEWDREIPADQSIRLDVPPTGWQMWSWYMLPRHRVTTREPLGGFFPHPPVGEKADLALVFKPAARPPDAVGAPLRENEGFALYRLRRDIPGFVYASRTLVWD